MKPFFSEMNWETWRDLDEIKKIALEHIQLYSGYTRVRMWELIVQEHFMRFTYSEYCKALNEMVKAGTIHSPTQRRQYRLNDNCNLHPGSGE